ncbi:hypothetical protein Q1695_004479 [Nippostrongylus brasiliensis]|nr:hypothetical protein Q1695_004479 [Nippostrongylus brasiliensis]
MTTERSTDGGTSEGSDQRTNQNPLDQNTPDGGGVAILTREQNPDANPLTNLLNAARDGSGVADLSEEDVLTAVQALTERYSSKFPVSTPPHSTEEQNVPLPVNPPSEVKDATLQKVGRKKKRPKRIQISPNYPSCVDHPGIRAGSISVTDQIGVNQLDIPCSGSSHRTVSSCKTPKSDDATTAREHRLVHSTKSQVDVTTRDSKEAPKKYTDGEGTTGISQVQQLETAVPLETEARKKVEAVDATIKTARGTETRTDISTVSSVTVKTKTTRRTVRTPRSTDRSSYAGERTSTRARIAQSGKRVIRTPKKGRATNRGLVDIDKVRRKTSKDLTRKQMIITKNELDASTAREHKQPEQQANQDNVKTAKESEALSKEKGKEELDEVSTARHELPIVAAHVETDNLGTAKDSKDITELAEAVQSRKEKANEEFEVSTDQLELPTLAAEPENLGTARDSNVNEVTEGAPLEKEKGKEELDVSTAQREQSTLVAPVEQDNLGTAKDFKETEVVDGGRPFKEVEHKEPEVSTARQELPPLPAQMKPDSLGTARDSNESGMDKKGLDASTARTELPTIPADVEKTSLSTAKDVKESETEGRTLAEEGQKELVHTVIEQKYEQQPVLETLDAVQAPTTFLQTSELVSDVDTAKDSKESETLGDVHPKQEKGREELDVSTGRLEMPMLQAHEEQDGLGTAKEKGKEELDVPTARQEQSTEVALVEQDNLGTARDSKETEADGSRPLAHERHKEVDVSTARHELPTLPAHVEPDNLGTARVSIDDGHPTQEKGKEEKNVPTARLELSTLRTPVEHDSVRTSRTSKDHEAAEGVQSRKEKAKEELDARTARLELSTLRTPVEHDSVSTSRASQDNEKVEGVQSMKEKAKEEFHVSTARLEQPMDTVHAEQIRLDTARHSKDSEIVEGGQLEKEKVKQDHDYVSKARHELPMLPAHMAPDNLDTARVSIDDGHPTQEKGKEEPNVPTAQLELSTLRTPVEHDSVRTSRASKDHETVEGIQSREERAKEELDAPTARPELSTLRTPVEHDSVRTSRAYKDDETVEGVQSRKEKAKEELDAPTARLEQPMEEAHVEQTKLDTARHSKDSEIVEGGQLEKEKVKQDHDYVSKARHELPMLPAHMAPDNLDTARVSIDDGHPTQEKGKEEPNVPTAQLELSTLRTPVEHDSVRTSRASKDHETVEGIQSREERAKEELDAPTARPELSTLRTPVEHDSVRTSRAYKDDETVEGVQSRKEKAKEELDAPTARLEQPMEEAHVEQTKLDTARHSKDSEIVERAQLQEQKVKEDIGKLSTARHELPMLPAHMEPDNLGTARISIDDGHPTQEKGKKEPDVLTARHELSTLRTPKEPDSLSTSRASKDNEKVEGVQSMKEKAKEEFHVSTARLEQPMDTVHAEQIRLDTARHSKESEMVEGGQLEKNEVKEDHDNLSTARHELPTLAAHMEPDNLGTARDSKETEQAKDGQLEKNEVKEDLDKLSTARHELPTLPAHMEQDNLGAARDSKETEVVEGVQSIEEKAKEELVVSTAQYQQTPLPAHVESDKLVTARDSNEAGKVERRRRRPFREVGPREPVTTAVEQKYELHPVFESFEAVPAPLTYLYTSEPVSDLDTVPSHGQHDSVSTAKGIGEPILSARAPTSPLLTAVPASEESTAAGTNMDAIVQGIATALANASERRPSDFSFSRMFPALFGQSAPQAGSSASDSSVATGAARNALLPPAYRVPSPPRRPSDPKRDVVLFLSIYANKHAIASKRTVEFFIGSYEAAQREARNDVRLIIVFIHDPNLEESARFIDHAINSIEFSDLVDRHRILLWGIGNDSEEGKFVAYNLHVNKYPFLALMCPRADGRFFSARRITGFTTATDLVSRLERSIEIVRVDLKDLREQRDKVLEDRRLMQEQERAYKESAERDKQRILAARKAKLEKLEADERERKKKKEYEERRKQITEHREQIRQQEEDKPVGKELVNIQVRFPCGKKFAKKFDIDDSMEKLFTAILRHDNCPDFFTVASGFPRRQLHCAPEWYHNLLSEQLEADGIQPTAYKTPSSFRAAGFNSKAVGVFVNSHSH